MLYEPNTHHWEVGDLVIHDCDAKQPYMLMRVVGYGRDGLCKTRYIEPKRLSRMRGCFRNELRFLHDPKRFNIEIPAELKGARL
jgi:hypothetical protein